MSKRKKRTSDKVVPHPRFGAEFIRSGYNVTEETVRDSFWGYASETIFVASAIPADASRQNFSVFPRGYYVDILKLCRDCKRKFIFFALEQKHWFEELGFYVDADCVRCTDCRLIDRDIQQRFQRYSKNICVEDPNDDTLTILVSDAVFLWNREMIRNEQTLRRLKNLALERIPAHPVAAEVNSLVDLLNLSNEEGD